MSRLYPICSSSKGNCTYIGTRGRGVLIDAGCSFKTLKNALSLIDTDIDEGVEALFITHEHIDHIKGVEQIMKHTKIPLFASGGTLKALFGSGELPPRVYNAFDGYNSADFKVTAFHTSHDAAEPVGYRVEFCGEVFAVCTDTGFITAEAENALLGARAVLLESNYDEEMLKKNMNYPPDLKRRIAGEFGHLSNNSSAEFAVRLVKNGTRHIVLAHLSQENNTPQTACQAVQKLLAQAGFFPERDYTLRAAPVNSSGEFAAF